MDQNSSNDILIYKAEDGSAVTEVRLAGETVWLRQEQMAQLFGRERSVITRHVGNLFKDGELDEESNVQNLHITGSDKPVKFYNLDVIISVGYRVKSQQGTRFRQWATATLREHQAQSSTATENGCRRLSFVPALPSAGLDWPGLAPAGDLLSCLCKKAKQRSTARFRAPAGFPPSGRPGRGASQTRPAGSNSEAPFSARRILRLARQRAGRSCPTRQVHWRLFGHILLRHGVSTKPPDTH